MRRIVSLLSLLMPLMLLSPELRADERVDQARAFFRQGTEAFQQGNPRAAAEAFESAHRILPHGATLYNAGLAWEAAEVWDRAAKSFDDARELGGLSALQASDSRVRLEALSTKVGLLRITAPPGSTISVAYVQRADPPEVVFLTPGTHEVIVMLDDGATLSKTVDVSTGRQDLDFQRPEADMGGNGDTGTTNNAKGISNGTLGWVAIGGAAALSGVAVYLGLEAFKARDSFNDSGHTDGEAHDRAASMRTWTNVAWVAAGASAATGVVLIVVGDDDGPQGASTGTSTQVRVGAGTLSLSGRF